MKLLETTGVALRMSKSKFFHAEVDHLGHVIRLFTLEIMPDMIKAVREATPSRTMRRVRSFLGLEHVLQIRERILTSRGTIE